MTLQEKIFLNRYAEEGFLRAFQAGKLTGTVHLSIGQECVDVGVVEAFRDLNKLDWVLGNHRSHGQFLAVTNNLSSLITQVFDGCTQHLYDPGAFMSNGIQGSMTPVAIGAATALKKEKSDRRILCFIGDGTLGEGIFYESLNYAAEESLPVTFVIIDNKYSMSRTSHSSRYANRVGSGLSAAFDVQKTVFDESATVEQVFDATRDHLKRLDELRPSLIIADTNRLCGHSCNDTERYRPSEERTAEWRKEADVLHSSYDPDEFHHVKEMVEEAFHGYL
ncbi:MAG TPA: thiamine pyrophosphate-dependent enzyme [Acidobacteriota bacterium]|nr:thiamine pyrophosphate-dependent enzyme [Acidobacteriota bacterium]